MDLTGPQTEFEAQEFRNASHKGDLIKSRQFDACTFSRCNFRECSLEHCTFRDCVFKDCDLSLARVAGCTFANCRFENCQLPGINWTEASWPKGRLREPLHFVECALNHSVFMGLELRRVTISKCAALDVDFTDCNLTQCDCRATDFDGSRFQHTNLTEADFTGARNYAIAVQQNTLKKTRFSLPEAMALLYGLDIILVE